jgi:predicted transposase YdaD
MTKPYDQAFKFFAEQDAASLLFLLGALPENLISIEPLSFELNAPSIFPDQLYLITTPEGKSIIHLEAQTRWDEKMPQRMPEYAVLAWLRYRVPGLSYVLVLSRKKFPLSPPVMGVIDAGQTQIVTHYQIIRLWEVSAAVALARESEELLPFVALMQGGEEVLTDVARRIHEAENAAKRYEMTMHFLVLGGLRYNKLDILELVKEKIMISLQDLRESSFYQMILEEGAQQGLETLEHAFRRLANNRFPGIEFAPELDTIDDLPRMGLLVEEILQFDSAAALNSRIKELAAQKTEN